MKAVVFGASGRVGSQVVGLLLERGDSVVAVVHSRNLFEPNPNLTVVAFDVHDQVKVTEVISGSQVILSCLSNWGSEQGDVLTAAIRAVVPAMKKVGVRRIIGKYSGKATI